MKLNQIVLAREVRALMTSKVNLYSIQQVSIQAPELQGVMLAS